MRAALRSVRRETTRQGPKGRSKIGVQVGSRINGPQPGPGHARDRPGQHVQDRVALIAEIAQPSCRLPSLGRRRSASRTPGSSSSSERGLGVSEAVNRLARAGLTVKPVRSAFRQRSAPLHLMVDVTNVTEALELLDGPAGR